ncbi:uncharacterized protein LOC115688570 [Syzygium oleosum]|uniref:uncharacterized protein LOC115688570 n=1 Tax=Syzygium oleosum TaxID=219896 RepID=UPI0011D1DA8E|nr:uncharacterized protein LOC115688570 [Syzygium oleosum]
MGGEDVEPDYGKLEKAVNLYQKALDDLVSMNSLFTVAVFVGLTFASSEVPIVEGGQHCELVVKRRLVKNEVISFACYLLSSLVAKALKTHLFTYLLRKHTVKEINDKSSKGLRVSLFALSALTTIIGGVLLLLSMIDIIKLRLGDMTCDGTETMNPIGTLIAINALALFIYVPLVARTIFKSTKIFDDLLQN